MANAGPNPTVRKNITFTLDGSKSADADGDTLTYQWYSVKPGGS